MLYIPRDYLVKVPMVKRVLAYIYQFHIMQSIYPMNALENDTVQYLPLSLSPAILSQSPSAPEVVTVSSLTLSVSTAAVTCSLRPSISITIALALQTSAVPATVLTCSLEPPVSTAVSIPSPTFPASKVITQSLPTTMPFMEFNSHKTVISTTEWILYQRGIVIFSILILAMYTCFIYLYYYRSRETVATLVDDHTGSKSDGSGAEKASKRLITAGRSLVGLRRKRNTFWSPNRSERLNHFRQRRKRREEKQRKNMDSRD